VSFVWSFLEPNFADLELMLFVKRNQNYTRETIEGVSFLLGFTGIYRVSYRYLTKLKTRCNQYCLTQEI
jgi:hypothetical protein